MTQQLVNPSPEKIAKFIADEKDAKYFVRTLKDKEHGTKLYLGKNKKIIEVIDIVLLYNRGENGVSKKCITAENMDADLNIVFNEDGEVVILCGKEPITAGWKKSAAKFMLMIETLEITVFVVYDSAVMESACVWFVKGEKKQDKARALFLQAAKLGFCNGELQPYSKKDEDAQVTEKGEMKNV